MQTRRDFLRVGAAAAGSAAVALSPGGSALAGHRERPRVGRLVKDPKGILDLPRGFRYRVVQTVEDTLSNGAPVPADFDGMVAMAGPGGSTVLVCETMSCPPVTRERTLCPRRTRTPRTRRAVRQRWW
ncbi:MAG: DUF839 domain-containing protein [Actinomycetota bacterium]|nr:DUF839 domain-containing protein [Actinomycetota bacterium]